MNRGPQRTIQNRRKAACLVSTPQLEGPALYGRRRGSLSETQFLHLSNGDDAGPGLKVRRVRPGHTSTG